MYNPEKVVKQTKHNGTSLKGDPYRIEIFLQLQDYSPAERKTILATNYKVVFVGEPLLRLLPA